jgi:hypothetical protein
VTKGRVLRSEITTADYSKGRVLRSEILTAVTTHAKGRVLRSEITTIAAPRGRVLRSEILTDVALVANAGPDQTVQSLDRVFLSALASSGDPEPSSFLWAVVSGPAVVFHPDASSGTPSFTAPATPAGTVIGIVVTALNGVDTPVSSPPMYVTVGPHSYWIGIAGQTLPARRFLSPPP